MSKARKVLDLFNVKENLNTLKINLKNIDYFSDYSDNEIKNIEATIETVLKGTEEIINYKGTDMKVVGDMITKILEKKKIIDNDVVVEGDNYGVSNRLKTLEYVNKNLPDYFKDLFRTLVENTESIYEYLNNNKYFNNLKPELKKTANELKDVVGMVDTTIKRLEKEPFYIGSYKYLDSLTTYLSKILDNKSVLISMSVSTKNINMIEQIYNTIKNPDQYLLTKLEGIKEIAKEIKSGLVKELEYILKN